jgi:enoyl-[acyl-carrier protein] reductase I
VGAGSGRLASCALADVQRQRLAGARISAGTSSKRSIGSSAGFHTAMEVSCYSFIRMAKLAEPLMREGSCLLTMSYLGAEKVVENYNLMGPVKAALESAVRYLAAELGPQGIRVHALSPGPLPTRAASGIAGFDRLMERAADRAPMKRLVSIDEVGATAAFLASDAAAALTGLTLYVDGGYQIMG